MKSLTITQWRNTTIKQRVHRVKDLRNFIKYATEEFGAECPKVLWSLREIDSIRQSIMPENAKELTAKITLGMQTAQRITEHGEVRGFTNVKSWFCKLKIGLVLGKIENEPTTEEGFYFVVSCMHDGVLKVFTLVEKFSENDCKYINEEQISMLTVATANRLKDWLYETKSLINELKTFEKGVE